MMYGKGLTLPSAENTVMRILKLPRRRSFYATYDVSGNVWNGNSVRPTDFFWSIASGRFSGIQRV